MASRQRGPMFYVVWSAVILLIVLHQDNFLWENPSLAWGFLPITLLYHLGISLAATVVWFLATRYAWPLPEEPAPVPSSKDGGCR